MEICVLRALHPFVVPRVYIEKINTTTDETRRSQLLKMFEPHQVRRQEQTSGSTSSHELKGIKVKIWGPSLFNKLKDGLHELGDTICNARDVLLAEAAITNGLVLLIANKFLADVVCCYGGDALFLGI